MGKWIFDRIGALTGLLILAPLLILIAIAVAIDSRGGIFYIQQRVGKGGRHFGLFKFRTMKPKSDALGTLTIGSRDPRITLVGYYLRKFKIDELPQLLNVLIADMSLVGPRPEVPEYAALYTVDQKRVLDVKPGITDYASLLFFHESELLAKSPDPQQTYINEVMPAKLALNLEYIGKRSFGEDLRIIFKTVARILSTR